MADDKISAEIKKCLEKINTKDDTKNLRLQLSYALYKRACKRFDVLNFLGSMYDLTESLQFNVSPICFFKRAEIFAKLEFYEQALADYQSSFEYTTDQKDKKILETRIAVVKEIVDKLQEEDAQLR